ncbi:MAG: transposase [Alphaproteobacteria bacterium]|nr:transposase [Alphaproteobacteria bacterium]
MPPSALADIRRRWPTEDDCLAHLERLRWGERPLCPYCGAERISHNRDATRTATAARWKCQRCLKSFSVTVGTIFHGTHVELQRWFALITLAQEGVSASEAARRLDMRRPTVSTMLRRIREATPEDARLLAALVAPG